MPHMGANELKQLGIGKKIRALREGKGLMLDDLAARAGLTKVLLGQIEEDVVPPTVATLLNLSKLLDVSIDYFFTEDEHIGRVEVTRIDERLTVHHDDLPDAGQVTYNYESLAYRLAKKHMEPFYVEFDSTKSPRRPSPTTAKSSSSLWTGKSKWRSTATRLPCTKAIRFISSPTCPIRYAALGRTSPRR